MKILIIGFGTTGKSLKNYFDKRGEEVSIYDKKNYSEKNFYDYQKLLNELPLFDLGIKSPGLAIDNEEFLLINSLCKNIESEIDFAYKQIRTKNIIGITGSNGKTSLATFFNHFLSLKYKTFLAGNIGKPLIDYIEEANEEDYIILELSSYQIRDSKNLKLKELFITSISPNHLDVYKSKLHYYADKKRTTFFTNNVYLLNDTLDKKYFNYSSYPLIKDFRKDIAIYISGKYSILYANICMNYCLNHNILEEKLRKRLISLKPVEYRMNKVFENSKLIFINDSKSTTAEASLYCFETFNNYNRILILGGNHKSSSFDKIKLNKQDILLIYGKDKEKINKEIHGIKFNNLEEIFLFLKEINKKYYVLFSPGCDSHDQYSSYKERGQHFNKLIEKYFNRRENE